MNIKSIKRYVGALKREPLPLLIKEAAWRMQRRLAQKQLPSRLKRDARVEWRSISYFKPDLSRVTAAQRAAIIAFADDVKSGRFPFLSYGTVDLGFPPKWNLDFVSGAEWAPGPYEHGGYVRHDGADVKAPYELSRLQFLPILGKAYRLTGDESYRTAAKTLLANWIEQNPPLAGVNWTIAMESALRGLSICFLLNLLSPFAAGERPWLDHVLRSLREHMVYTEGNLEFSYLLTSNHYLSNIVGLYCMSVFLDGHGMERRRRKYRSDIEREMLRQVYSDGGDYEASLGYHALVTQLFTTALQANRAGDRTPFSGPFVQRLRLMYRLMNTLANESGELPIVGDCDDGRVEFLSDDLLQMTSLPLDRRHPLRVQGLLGVGERLLGEGAGAPDDAAWYGLAERVQPDVHERQPEVSVAVLPQSGIAVVRAEGAEVQFFAIPNGIAGHGSHTHNDKLSFVLRLDGTELICDPGTGCYTRDAAMRNRFRRTAAHNTLLFDNQEQNTIDLSPSGLFRIGDEASVSAIEHALAARSCYVRASHAGYRSLGITHTRTIRLSADDRNLVVEDRIDGSDVHACESNLHFASGCVAELSPDRATCRIRQNGEQRLVITIPDGWSAVIEDSLVSNLYGHTIPAPSLRISSHIACPATVTTVISWARKPIGADTGQLREQLSLQH